MMKREEVEQLLKEIMNEGTPRDLPKHNEGTPVDSYISPEIRERVLKIESELEEVRELMKKDLGRLSKASMKGDHYAMIQCVLFSDSLLEGMKLLNVSKMSIETTKDFYNYMAKESGMSIKEFALNTIMKHMKM